MAEYFDRFPEYRQWPLEDRELTVLPRPLIDFDTPIMTIGSCFAEYIMVWFGDILRFNVYDPHWGYKYSTVSILRAIRRALEKRLTTAESLYKGEMGYTDLHHHRIYDDDKKTALWKINQIERRAAEMLPQAKILVVTLGQNEVWKNLRRNEFINHPYPGVLEAKKDLEVHFLTADENAHMLEEMHHLLIAHIPDIQIIVTVSPIPLRVTYRDMDAVVGNNMSKFTLYVAATEFSTRHDNVHYFPSFDIFNYECKYRRHWKEDGRHLVKEAVPPVMTRFADAFCNERTRAIVRLRDELDLIEEADIKMPLLEELGQWGYPSTLLTFEKAQLFIAQGRRREAIENLGRLELAQRSPMCQLQLGWLWLESGQPAQALTSFENTVALLSDIAGIAFSGAKRDNHILYGGNQMQAGENFYERRAVRMMKIKQAAAAMIAAINNQKKTAPAGLSQEAAV